MMMLDIPAETLHRPASPYNERITHFCRVLQRDYKMCSVMLIYPPFVIGKHCKNAFDACVLIKEKLCQRTKFPWWQSLTEFYLFLIEFQRCSFMDSCSINWIRPLDLKQNMHPKTLHDFILNCPDHYLTLIFQSQSLKTIILSAFVFLPGRNVFT